MSTTHPPSRYEAVYNSERLHGVPNLWVQCEGIRLESNLGFPFITDICRALKEAGHVDGSIAFFEDGYVEPTAVFPSVYEISERPPSVIEPKPAAPPSALSAALYDALNRIASGDWNSVHRRVRSLLLDRGFVTIDGEMPSVSDAGHAELARYRLHPPSKSEPRIYPDIETAGPAELAQAAELIGLKINGQNNIGRILRYIETTIADRSLAQIEDMTRRAQLAVRLGRGSDDMKKRKALAKIINAGKLAEAV